jgi:Domain of unknown function (DUF3883)
MRDQLGSDRVYDVIDDLLEDVPLVSLIEKAIDSDDAEAGAAAAETALAEASQQKAEGLIALQERSSLSSRLNLRAARELRDASDEKRLQPLFIQRFFERAWIACGGTIKTDDHFPVWHLGLTPVALLDLARERRSPLADRYETPFVFDKQLLSVASRVRIPDHTKLLGPGHPLLDILIEWAIRESHRSFAKGTVLVDPNLATPQRVWLVRSTVQDGRVESRKRLAHERLIAITLDRLGIRSTSPAYLLDCVAPIEKSELPNIPGQTLEELQAWAYQHITEEQLQLVSQARADECALRRSYLNTAFTDLILGLQGELNDLQQESLFGDDNALERERLEKRIAALRTRKVDRMRELDLMLNLTANLPDVLTQALIIPPPVAVVEGGPGPMEGVPVSRDDEVEAIAMAVAERYERSRGWQPFDVSKDGEHYDIRSESSTGEKRFIEVKGRTQSGGIVLTLPELDKLRQLSSRAWLYIATFCRDERPRLRIIQDPVLKLHPEMLYRNVQFFVEESDWSEQGADVEVV